MNLCKKQYLWFCLLFIFLSVIYVDNVNAESTQAGGAPEWAHINGKIGGEEQKQKELREQFQGRYKEWMETTVTLSVCRFVRDEAQLNVEMGVMTGGARLISLYSFFPNLGVTTVRFLIGQTIARNEDLATITVNYAKIRNNAQEIINKGQGRQKQLLSDMKGIKNKITQSEVRVRQLIAQRESSIKGGEKSEQTKSSEPKNSAQSEYKWATPQKKVDWKNAKIDGVKQAALQQCEKGYEDEVASITKTDSDHPYGWWNYSGNASWSNNCDNCELVYVSCLRNSCNEERGSGSHNSCTDACNKTFAKCCTDANIGQAYARRNECLKRAGQAVPTKRIH